MVRFGGNEFKSLSVPLVFAGRHFILEAGNPPLLSVFIEHEGGIVFEVLKNNPMANQFTEVSRSGAGIITVSEKRTNRFLYKIRPGSETSVAFGMLEKGNVVVRITDAFLQIGSTKVQNNVFDDNMAGVIVDESGTISIGVRLPQSVVRLLTSS
jgi:hypothetical protein